MKGGSFQAKPFEFAPGDALSGEHAVILRWVTDAMASLGPHERYRQLELKSLPSGQAILDAESERARRLVMAAVAQVCHWDKEVARVRSQGTNEHERVNAHFLPGWNEVWGRRRQTETVIATLTRRSLPFDQDDLTGMVEWCNAADRLSTIHAPLGNITRALRRFAANNAIRPPLNASLRRFAERLRESYEKDAKRFATSIEQLIAPQEESASDSAIAAPSTAARAVAPARAGNPSVLVRLKQHLGLAAPEAVASASETVGLDQFPLGADSPLASEHKLISELFPEVVGTIAYTNPDLASTSAGKRMLALDDAARGRLLLAAAERDVSALLGRLELGDHRIWQSRTTAAAVVPQLVALPFTVDRDGTFDFLLYIGARLNNRNRNEYASAIETLVERVEGWAATEPISDGERYVLHMLRASSIGGPPLGNVSPQVTRLTNLIGDAAMFHLVPGEAWADAVNADIAALALQDRAAWTSLLKHALTATGSRPTAKWLKGAAELAAKVSQETLASNLLRWFPLVSKGRTLQRMRNFAYDARSGADTMHEENAIALRGLLWMVPSLDRKADLVRDVAAVGVSAYRKVPGVGPRAVKVGNAAVYALSEIASPEAVGQLAQLKVRVKFGTAQKEIEKAFNASAEALGLPRDQIEEMGVPSYGLEEVGLRRESFGDDVRAELHVNGRDVSVTWFRGDGKPQKSVPASVKAEHKEEWKELQTAAKDIAAMLPAQVERIDQTFLLQKRWDASTWRERYLDHPLVGTIARRLIWRLVSNSQAHVGIWHDDRIVDVNSVPIDVPSDAQVELWHPIGSPMDEVIAWRMWLEQHEVRQPFKQAHREVYLLTDAERRTATYSNRFAAHILRQHQFNALCAARGWRNKLRLMVDDVYPPATRELANWGLRAEFWIEGIGDNYGQDISDSGTYLRIATDQVRFYRTGAAPNRAHAGGGGYTADAAGPGANNINEPLPLEQIPPLVFSEILRDVDLFVGVASVGNDPTWQDGGLEGRYRTYWHNYSFGELSETAQTRRAVLERLLPRLTKIRDRCTLSDRFLIVRGDLRTYKIHLGSGNILMEPNDQYLCIVPTRSTSSEGPSDVFLPFEGDGTLSIILSKAFLLAADTKIKDATITRQIDQ